MPPFIKTNTNEIDNEFDEYGPGLESDPDYNKENKYKDFKAEIVWRNVYWMAVLHIGALYGIYLCFTDAKWQTIVAAFVLYLLSGLGITGGVHRLWSHCAYKAKFPLRLFLAFFQTMAFQNSIFEWSRDHRMHHKYSETDADPHNSKRGFFFAHVGWLLCRKHPEVKAKGRNIIMDDLLRDPIVRIQKKFYLPLVVICCFVIPTLIPMYLWNETITNSYFICAILRYIWTLHMTWLVNSAAHMWGRHPYDKYIYPAENYFTVYFAVGEGFHNYHHVFPWDYAASELGWRFNLTTMFINLMAAIGQAYDLKRVSKEMIVKRKLRTGDIQTHGNYGIYNPLVTNNNSIEQQHKVQQTLDQSVNDATNGNAMLDSALKSR